MRIKTNNLLVISCLSFFLLTGCTVLSLHKTTQPTLDERVNGYMQAQVDKKWSTTYSFFDSESKQEFPRETFIGNMSGRKIAYTGYRIEDIKVQPSGDQATVKVRIDLLFMGHAFTGDHGGPQTQFWSKEKGNWFVRAPMLTKSQSQTPMGK